MNQDTVESRPFSFIKKFVDAVAEQFGVEHRPVSLYSHLFTKITNDHPFAISKNINLFRTFATDNREAIYAKDISKISNPRISYSDKVYLDLGEIFKMAEGDEHTQKVLWTHILLISALVDPTGKAKQVLSEKPEKKENKFMTDILDKVEKAVPTNASPQDALGSIMSSGLFTDIMGSMTSGIDKGELDVKSLLGTAANAMKGIKGEDANMGKAMDDLMKGLGEEGGDMNKVVGDMMKGLTGGEDGAPPDLGKMMSGVMKGLSGKEGELGDMMNTMMKSLGGGEDGAAPDLGKMMEKLSGGEGGVPDLSEMMSSMMSSASTPDSSTPTPPPPTGGEMAMLGSLLGVPQLPKPKPTDLSRLAPPDSGN